MGKSKLSPIYRAFGSAIIARKAIIESSPLSSFSDPESVARYAEGPVRMVPGFHGLQKMTGLLLAERAGEDANVLVIGAGGGLELKVFAEAQARLALLRR